jgi:ligand-binding sensor domain-containing protein/serine phosphatase RsbU (regulator of sigma subunit)
MNIKTGRFISVLLLCLFFSCGQNSPVENNALPGADSIAEAPGILMNADSIQPPVIVPAGKPFTVKAGLPEIIFFRPHNGESGGITHMQNYTTDNGLALDAITYGNKSAICDRAGNLWFGTPGGGVSRYDGTSFSTFTTTNGLANNAVLCITEDKDGNMWFGTDGGGASLYDGTSFTNFTTEDGLAGNNIFSILQDKSGNMWFSTSGGGISCYNGRSFTNYTTAQGLPGNIVLCICEDKSGDLWFSTFGGGISRYSGKSFSTYTTAQGLAANDVRCIVIDNKGYTWFGTYGAGVSCYDGVSFINYTTADGLADNTVLCSTKDRTGNLWFGTNGGVSRYDGTSFTNFTTAQGLASNSIRSITEDKEGNLWFGTYGGGVSRYDGKSFTNFTTAQGLGNNSVSGITEDKNGNMWFGTSGGGASRYDGTSFANYGTAQGLANNSIRSIIKDKSGNLWFSTSGDGVVRYDGNFFSSFTMVQGLCNNTVFSITEDKNGTIWFGTDGGGASRYDGRSFTTFTTAQGLANNEVFCMAEDKSGNMWLGTSGGGVSRYDGRHFTNFTTAQGLADNDILCITADTSGNVWFGTSGGLSRYDGRSFINYTTTQGLPDNTVTQIVISKEQNILIGTNLGIGVITFFLQKPGSAAKAKSVAALNKLGNRELQQYNPVVEIYNSATGYPIKDVNAGQNAMYCNSKGITWAATGADKTALVRFDYAALHKNTDPPTVIIQRVKINEENICWHDLEKNKKSADKKKGDGISANVTEEVSLFGRALGKPERDSMQSKFSEIEFDSISTFYPLPQHLVLPHEHNQISFLFAAIEPARPYLVNYQYLLEGYDKEWSPAINKTDVSYGNMYEGSYTFKIKACSPSGIWSKPLSYSFTVLPPWYRTWWMYFIYACLAILLITVIVRWNSKKLRARAQELKIKVEEATLEIRNQKEVVEEQKHLIEEKHKEITDSINYAERIQRALLAGKKTLDENLDDHFILFKPKDVVSGDFYWAAKLNNGHFILVTADSTGHGVPGAIMSIVNIACLKEAVMQGISDPSLLMNETRRLVIEHLKNDGSTEGGKDGMDASLLSFDFNDRVLRCACANNPVWVIRDKQLIEIKADRFPVGKHDKDQEPFTLHTLNLQKGDVVYALTDGFPDQFGGPAGKKFKQRQLQDLLLSIAQEPMDIQQQKLNDVFDAWKGGLEQVDDVCVVGVRV